MMFYLYYVLYPIGICLLLLMMVVLAKVARKRSHKVNQRLEVFDEWVRKVWPNKTQKEAIVLFVIVGFFIWIMVK